MEKEAEAFVATVLLSCATTVEAVLRTSWKETAFAPIPEAGKQLFEAAVLS